MAMTKFTRGGSSGVDAEPLVDGQVLIDREVGRILLDTSVDETLTRVPIKEGIFTGNSAEWESLSDEEKEVYTFVNLTDDFETTSKQFTGATATANGNAGLVTQPLAGDQTKFLKGNGTWGTVTPLIANEEETITAQQAYVVGQFLVYNNNLYRVIAAIAQGDTFEVGVNIELTAICNQITNIEDEFTANGNKFYFDYQNGKYGYNTSPTRGADTFNPFSSGPINSNWVGVTSTTIATAGTHLITIANGWIDRINWTTAQKITVNNVDIPIFWQPLMQGSRDQGGVEQYYRAMVTVAFADLKVGDVVRGYKRGIYDSGYVAITPTIWRYEP